MPGRMGSLVGEDASSADPVVAGAASPGGAVHTGDSPLIQADGDITATELPEESSFYDPGVPAALGELRDAIASLTEQIAMDHARAAAREKIIDRLHGEVERLRAGEVRLLLRPVIADLRQLHHDLLAEARSAAGTISPAQAVALLESFAESAELALERCGIAVIRPEPGGPGQPGLHQVTGFEPTGDDGLDGRIFQITSEGYLDVDSGRPIAPARVIIYRACQPEAGPEPDQRAGAGSRSEESPPTDGTDRLPSM